MKPCPFFLEGKCRFDEHSCKFSHGHVVPFSELRPFQDPDFRSVLAPNSLSGSLTWWGGEGDKIDFRMTRYLQTGYYHCMVDEKEQELTNHHNKRLWAPLHGAYKLLEGEWVGWRGGAGVGGEGEMEDQVLHQKLWSWCFAFKFDQYYTLLISVSFSSTYMHVQPCSCGWKVSCKIHRWIMASCSYKVGCV